ncbi:MAG: hypothetical protein EBQ85_07560, partial [Proteobacteria bacterium]|nr:hypothetical protein [Pseudomonadota bacterium]
NPKEAKDQAAFTSTLSLKPAGLPFLARRALQIVPLSTLKFWHNERLFQNLPIFFPNRLVELGETKPQPPS